MVIQKRVVNIITSFIERAFLMNTKLVVCLLLVSVFDASAAQMQICPGKVHHVLLEEGNTDPPTYLIPDVASGDKTRAQHWNYIYKEPDLPRVVVHCMYDKQEKREKDIPLSNSIHHCKYFRNVFSCRK